MNLTFAEHKNNLELLISDFNTAKELAREAYSLLGEKKNRELCINIAARSELNIYSINEITISLESNIKELEKLSKIFKI